MSKLIRIALVFFLLLAFGVGGLVFSAGSLVKKAVETGGETALGVPTTLEGTELAFFDGRFGLTGLQVANPAGFDGPHFVSMRSAEVELPLSRLTGDVVDVPRFTLDGLDLVLQRKDGKSNYGAILESIERMQGDAPDEPTDGEPPAEEGEAKDAKKFIIRRIELKNIVAHLDLLPAGGELTKLDLGLPELVLEDVGNAEGGVTVSELVGLIVQVATAATIEAAGDKVPMDVLNDLKDKLGDLDGLKDALGEQFAPQLDALKSKVEDALGGDVTETLDGLGTKVDEITGGELKKRAEDLEGSVKKGLDGLLGGKKKE